MRVLLSLFLIGIAGCGTGIAPATPDTADPFKGIQGSVSIGQGGFERVRILFDEDEAKIRMQFMGSQLSETSTADVEFFSRHDGTKTPEIEKLLPDFKVQLKSNPDGELTDVRFGQKSLGDGKEGLKKLNLTIRELVAGSPYADEVVVVIEADGYGGRMTPRLRYEWVVRAIVACTVTLLDKGQDKLFVQHVDKLSVDPPDSPVPGVKVVGKVRKR